MRRQLLLVHFRVHGFGRGATTTAAGPAEQPILTGIANGATDQAVIFDNLPGDPVYSALRTLPEVTWEPGKTARVLGSAADVKAAEDAGEVMVKSTGTVVNAPLLEFGQVRHAGYAKGKTIEHYELGRVAIAPGNDVLPIHTFTNGVADQKKIADTEPGTTVYPPLWAVVAITWNTTATPRLLTSFEEIKTAEAAGEFTLKNTPDVVSCPFL